MMIKWNHYRLQHAAPDASSGGTTPPNEEDVPSGSEVDDLDAADPVLDEYLDAAGGPKEPTGDEPPDGGQPPAGETTPPPTPAAPDAPEASPAAPQAPAPAQPATATPQPPATPPTTEQPQPPAPVAAPTPPTTPPAPPAPGATPEETAAKQKKFREEFVQSLEGKYTIPEEFHDELMTAPEKALPKLAAQMHVAILDDLVPAIVQNLPRIIEQVQVQSSTRDKLENDYYTMWPALKDNDGKAVTARLLPAYLQANPQATVEQAMREVGIAAMTTLQRPIQMSPTGAPPPAAPATPASTGYTPAAPGGAGGVPGGAKLGEWQQMAEDLLQED